MISNEDILKLQGYAVETSNTELLDLAYQALGFGRRVPVVPLAHEVEDARKRCAIRLDSLRKLGVQL